MGRLDGKVALITGGARGMGKSHARHFAAEGARVVIGDVLDDRGSAVADGPGRRCRYVHHDVTSEDDWAAAVATAVNAFGRLDVLVNNAGILRHAPIAEMAPDEFRRVLDVNLVGCWLGINHVIAPMTAAGGGSIVNVSSIEGFVGAAGLSAYSASKFGVRGVTKSAAQELGAVRHPGQLGAPRRGDDRDGAAAAETLTDVDPAAFLKSLPIARFAEPVEISRLVAFLASDESRTPPGRVHRRRRPAQRTGLLRKSRPRRPRALRRPGRRGHRRRQRARREEAPRWPPRAPGWCSTTCPADAVDAVADEITAAGGEAVVCRRRLGRVVRPARSWYAARWPRSAASTSSSTTPACCATGWSSRCPNEEWDLVMRVHLRGHFVTTRFATAYWRERSKAAGGPVYAPDRQHLLGGVPARLRRAAQLRRRQGGHRRADARHRTRLRPLRRARQRHLPARPHRDDRRADGRRPGRRGDPLPPEHVAPLVTYLASPAGGRITGEVFVVHGGVVAVMDPPRSGPRSMRRTTVGGRHVDPRSEQRALAPLFSSDPPPPASSARTRCPGRRDLRSE